MIVHLKRFEHRVVKNRINLKIIIIIIAGMAIMQCINTVTQAVSNSDHTLLMKL